MHVETLDLLAFRNISHAHLELNPGFNVFYGANAQGKSNLLEALYTLAFLKGFRAPRSEDLIEFDHEKAQLAAVIQNESARTRLSLELAPKSRRVYIDGMPCARVRDYLGILRAILFTPSDVAILQNAPAERRTALDRMVFNLRPAYLLDLEQYQKICKQKSALLRSESPDQNLLDVYDAQILPVALKLITARYRYLELLAPYVTQIFAQIFDNAIDCQISYKCASFRNDIQFGTQNSASLEDVIQVYTHHHQTARAQELASQQIRVGPHRDDWSVRLNGRPARMFASQGQQRAISLAIKMAEITCLRKEAGIEPIFLLDDVSSELDPVRHKKLFDTLNSLTTQAFLTTTSRNHVPIDSIGRLFKVDAGSITHEP